MDHLHGKFIAILTDDEKRQNVQYYGVFILLGAVSAFMTVLNVFTHKGLLTLVTFGFAVLCIIDFFILFKYKKKGKPAATALFLIEIAVLFIFFIISGNPDGFSAIWICMLPTCGMLLFGLKKGTVFSTAMFAVLVFFYWTPPGRGLLRFDYGETFMMRFPLLYAAFYALSFLLEYIRTVTQRELDKMRETYKYLNAHDFLTNLLNRRGLEEWRMSVRTGERQAAMMLDIDHFKRVNDTYGHAVGDLVLVSTAQEIAKHTDSKICRWGGEEFVVWSPDGSLSIEDAEAIRMGVENMVVHVPDCDKTVRVTISIGLAWAGPETELEELVKTADERLYRAKESGRNKVVYD